MIWDGFLELDVDGIIRDGSGVVGSGISEDGDVVGVGWGRLVEMWVLMGDLRVRRNGLSVCGGLV